MSKKAFEQPIEEQILFFGPIIEDFTGQLTRYYSKKNKVNLTDSEWWIIANEREAGQFPKHHILELIWAEFSTFLKGQSKLFCFIEQQTSSLVSEKIKIWLFFQPALAGAFFRRQGKVPKGFGPKTIAPIPFLNLLNPFKEKVETFLNEDSGEIRSKLHNFNTLNKIGDHFLPEKDLTEFHTSNQQKVSYWALKEILLLLNDVNLKGASPTLLKKRLKSVFTISWRYFRDNSELENKYYKKLLADVTEEQTKGLKLAKKKISDFIAASKG